MKKLRKILFFGIISIFIVPKVFALTNFTTSDIKSLNVYINNHSNLSRDEAVEAWKNSILENITIPTGFEDKQYYIITLNNHNDTNTSALIYYYASDFKQNIAMNANNNPKYLSFRNNNSGNFYECHQRINFNSLGEFVSFSSDWGDCSTISTWSTLLTSNDMQYIISTNYDYFTFKAPSWSTGSFSIDNQTEYFYETSEIPVNFTNGSRYNFNVTDNFGSNEPILYTPQIEHFDGYDKVTYYIDNFTIESNQEGYQVLIKDNTNGTIDNISPDVNNINQVIIKEYYENTSITFGLYQWNSEEQQLDEIVYWNINTNIDYEENKDYSIKINSVSNPQKIVYYDYLINNNNNVKCYYSINDSNFIEDENCTDKNNTYYLQLNNNGNITWEIRDLQDNILYTYSQNFIFNVANPFINFKDNFNNNFLNLDILINRYENNDVVEYSINNSQFIQVNYLEDYSVSQGIKYFTINNVNNNELIIVRVKRNDSIITTARYRANYLKYSNTSNENFNINNIFNKIDINNINEELKNYIKQFGNLILNSKIGNLLLLQTFCLVITLIIKMIRN